MPLTILRTVAELRLPNFSVNIDRSAPNICDTLTTLTFGRLPSPILNRTLPRACARCKLLEIAQTRIVPIRELLVRLFCTTTYGRRFTITAPVASARSSKKMSPCRITTAHPRQSQSEVFRYPSESAFHSHPGPLRTRG